MVVAKGLFEGKNKGKIPPARRGAPPPGPPDGSAARDPRRPPATPRDINIGLIDMDRTIQYFQDRTDIWIVRSTISRIGLSMDRTIQYFQDMRKLKNSDFQYFQDMRKLKKSDFQYL